MPQRALTLTEKESLERSVESWLSECQRWVDEFEKQAKDFTREWSEMMDGFPADRTPLINTSVYFILAAGCVYLHCQSLLEAKFGDKTQATCWLDIRRNKASSLNALRDRRDWVNHGAIYRKQDFELAFEMYKGTTIAEALAQLEIKINEGASVGTGVDIGEVIQLRWINEPDKTSDNISDWQNQVLLELRQIVEEIKSVT